MVKCLSIKPLVVFFLVLSVSAFGQVSITGTVISNEDDGPLPGVTIFLKGTTQGTTTDLDGYYSIEAAAEDILVFSYIGFAPKEIAVGSKTQINVSLEPDITSLQEVVVMGYSEKSQKELSASVVSLSARELQNVTSPRLETMLQGKVPGLIVSSPSGQPGTAADIRIRGITSLNADRPPLMVVDGMIGGNFVPTDIETVTVLKDAAAIGLYGAAGAAGVIIISTKQAKAGTTAIEFSSRVGFKEATTGNFEMMNSAELYETQEKMWGNPIQFLNNRPESLLDTDFNWMNAAFQRAMIQNYNIAMRGAKDDISYNFSVDYFDEEGTFINTDFKRLNLRGSMKFSPSEKLSVQSDINAQVAQDNINHYSWFEDAFWNVPWDKPTHLEDGVEVYSSPQYVTDSQNGWIGQFKRNFLNSTRFNELGSKGQDVVWSVRTTYDFTSWLTFETRTRLNSYRSSYNEYFSPRTDQGISDNGAINVIEEDGWGVLSTHFLRFSTEFGDHSLSGFIAQEGGYSIRNYSNISVINLSSPSIKVIDGGSGTQSESGGKGFGGYFEEGSGVSFISELSYGFKGRYFATAYARTDASSVFAENFKYGFFPGGSFAWLMSEEPMLSSLSAIDLLKLRLSYGMTGNSNIDPYLSLPTYNLTRQYNGQPAAEPNNPANPNLQWETTRMANAGVDLELFNSITTTVDVYHKSVEGMLLRNPLAPSVGYEGRTENQGDMVNRGVELSLSYTKTFGKWSYSSNFNTSYNKNEITRITDVLDEQPVIAGGVRQINAVGQSAFTWYMPVWAGVDPANGSPVWEVVNYDGNGNEIGKGTTSNYAEASLIDNFQSTKSALPKYTGGFSNSVSYQGITLSFLLTFQTGNYIYHYTRQFVDTDGANTGINFMRLADGWSRWENPGDEATHPVLARGGSNGAHNYSSRYLEKGDFVRLRNVSLSYSLPDRVTQWARIRGATLSVSGDNLITLTEFSGMDPDVGLQVQQWSLPGMSYLKYPISKQVIFGLNVNF